MEGWGGCAGRKGRAGQMRNRPRVPTASLDRRGEEADEGARLLGFIQMVSPTQEHRLARGGRLFSEGDPVEKFYILTGGRLSVSQDGVALGEINAGEGIGEMSLLEGRPRRTKTVTCACDTCELVGVSRADFLRLVEKTRPLRTSMQQLAHKRTARNELEEQLDPVFRKLAAR